MARIEHERGEREKLEQQRQELLKRKQKLIADNKKRKDDLANLDKDLERFIDVGSLCSGLWLGRLAATCTTPAMGNLLTCLTFLSAGRQTNPEALREGRIEHRPPRTPRSANYFRLRLRYARVRNGTERQLLPMTPFASLLVGEPNWRAALSPVVIR